MVAYAQMQDTGAHSLDDARALMTQHHRERRWQHPALMRTHIGMADAGSPDAHQYFIGSRGCQIELFNNRCNSA
jgi:hypothetical protein